MEYNYEMRLIEDQEEDNGIDESTLCPPQESISASEWIPGQYCVAISVALGYTLDNLVLYRFEIHEFMEHNEKIPLLLYFTYFGACVGSILSAILMHKFGYKIATSTSAIFFILCFLQFSITRSSIGVEVTEFIAGMGYGGIYLIVPAYLVEIAEENSRGRMAVIMLVMSLIGRIITGSLIYIKIIWLNNLLCLIIAVVFLGVTLWIPETPQYLISIGCRTKALNSLCRLRGDAVIAQQQLEVMEVTIRDDNMNQLTWIARLTNRRVLNIIAVTMGLLIFMTTTGIKEIMDPFIDLLVRGCGMKIPAAVLISLTRDVALACIPLFIVDRVSRRFLLMSSSCGAAISYGLLFIIYYFSQFSGKLVLETIIRCIFYVMGYIGMGSLPPIIVAELMPNKIRCAGCAIVYVICYLLFLTYWNIMSFFNIRTYYAIYGVSSVICVIYVAYLVPETKGKIL